MKVATSESVSALELTPVREPAFRDDAPPEPSPTHDHDGHSTLQPSLEGEWRNIAILLTLYFLQGAVP